MKMLVKNTTQELKLIEVICGKKSHIEYKSNQQYICLKQTTFIKTEYKKILTQNDGFRN